MPEPTLSREPAAANWFIGLEVPPLAAWEGLTQGLPDGMRRFTAPDRHLTLAFLGSCGTERAGRAWTALAGLSHAPIIATAAAWRAMGPRGRPSAYAITLAMGGGTAAALIGDWGDRALLAAGLPRSRRRPLPHITLLRPPRRRAASLWPPMRRWLRQAPLPSGPFRLETLALYTWSSDRAGRLFRIVAERPLDSPESQVSPCRTTP
jgi:2'-5' RNA ligase